MAHKVKHGGKRKGAGKPAQYSEPMVKVDFMLPKEAIEFYTLLGDGNRSKGARRAWRSLTPRALDVPVVTMGTACRVCGGCEYQCAECLESARQ